MTLKKSAGILLALSLVASAFAPIGTLSARADALQTPAVETASSVVFNRDNAELQLPATYEQYLPLNAPAYIAMNANYIAVADGSSIYVYDRAAKEYDVYRHLVGDTPTEASVSKLQFTDDGKLYFRDNRNSLYRYDFTDNTASIVDNISCMTFLIYGEYMYIANESNTTKKVIFTYVPVNDLRLGAVTPLTSTEFDASNPRMAYDNGTLYCITDNNTVYSYDGTTHTYLGRSELDKELEQIANLQFVYAYQNEFFYTVNGANSSKNGLYRTDKAGNKKDFIKGDGYTSIASYNGKLYCVVGSTIREISVTETSLKPTGYEISSASSAPHRLANAGEIVRAKDLIAIADTDNKRVSVHNRIDGTYTSIPCSDRGEPFVPEHVAIDKEEFSIDADGDEVTTNRIAVSNKKKLYVYTFERHSRPTEKKKNGVNDAKTILKETTQDIKGLTFVYGECYYITDNNGYGSVNVASPTGFYFSSKATSPTAISSDVYGTIYVTFGNEIYTFTEKELGENGANGTHLADKTLSSDSAPVYIGITVDYEGNLWHATNEGKLYCNNRETATIDGKDFVFIEEEHDYPVSFALSFEDDEIYFNFKNYVVKTKAHRFGALPSLNKIASDDAKTKTFELANRDNLFVKIPTGSVGFEIDLYALKTGDSELTLDGRYFPYTRYFRFADAPARAENFRRGVLLYAPTDDNGYYVVALYDAKIKSFTANLFKKSKNRLEIENNFTEKTERRYLTSDISLYTAPCLYPAPKSERLSVLSNTLLKRGARLNVLGHAEGEDRTYAYIEVSDANGSPQKGFIPLSYLTTNDPLGVSYDRYTLGYLKGDALIVLTSESGSEFNVTENTQVKLYRNDDGTFTAVAEKEGVLYRGTVTNEMILRNETNALKYSLIVMFSVLALVIVAAYAFLMFPRKDKNHLK